MGSILVQLEADEVRFLKEFVKKGVRKTGEIYKANTILLSNKSINN